MLLSDITCYTYRCIIPTAAQSNQLSKIMKCSSTETQLNYSE
uniref:Uncharacterized protein n=1 Tax=Anguilla anguilla TaxID=7936 RepID=A0A0E9QSD5_ANGAN